MAGLLLRFLEGMVGGEERLGFCFLIPRRKKKGRRNGECIRQSIYDRWQERNFLPPSNTYPIACYVFSILQSSG